MPAKVGFLTVRRHEEHGYFGGYLVVNHLARPLEFHCTLPVKPSRAQTVLYGPTIEDFVCGEQIGKALVSRAKVAPDLIVTDSPAALAMCLVSDQAIVQVEQRSASDSKDQRPAVDGQIETSAGLQLPMQSRIQVTPWVVGNHHFYLPESGKCQRENVEKLLSQLGDRFDFYEPFTRIVEALMEAHPTTKAA